MSAESEAYARAEMLKLQERYAREDMSVEELEDETRFWLKVEQCDFCGHPGLCNSHYDYMYSYGMQ